MSFHTALSPDQLFRACKLDSMEFETTDELEDLPEPIAQDRAIRAIQFGIGIQHDGYNLFLLGPSGAGKHALLKQVLEQQTRQSRTPDDWCYVNNFDNALKPIAIRLPAGTGEKFKQDMKEFTDVLTSAIRSAFENENYLSQEREIQQSFRDQETLAFQELEKIANSHSIAFLRTDSGFVFGPLRNGKILGPQEFKKLPKEEQEDTEKTIAYLQEKLQKLLLDAPSWNQELRKTLKELSAKTARLAVGHLIDQLQDKYRQYEQIQQHLIRVENDIVENVDTFRFPESQENLLGLPSINNRGALVRHYQVNLLVNHTHSTGSPVVYLANPTHDNLIGKTEYLSHMGTLVTDFMMVRPGALHEANGGYLVIDAHKILTQPYAWEALKRLLSDKQIKIESLAQSLGILSTVSLEPEPVPINIKVILMGERIIYYLLSEYDTDFAKLFKVAADFEIETHRDDHTQSSYARLLATLSRQNNLLPFSKRAVSRVIEHSARLMEHSEKLSVHMGDITDLLFESDYWAKQNKHKVVEASDVQQCIHEQIFRLDRVQHKVYEQILEGSTLIDTQGSKPAQVNGLSVIALGNYMFGQPSRITATARPGEGKLVDIEHESDLGGEIHTKAVLILSHFLASRYALNRTFSLSASIGFEQSYGGIEGDSASIAELCAVLSAACNVPVKQNLAITGSINQLGEIQVIGGVNEKIESFFDICEKRGLTGDQGVIIPYANANHLMLKQEVVQAAEQGKFSIYAIKHVDEAIELLTGMVAGQRDENGMFPEDSFNYLVEDNLLAMAEVLHARHDDDNEEKEEHEHKEAPKEN